VSAPFVNAMQYYKMILAFQGDSRGGSRLPTRLSPSECLRLFFEPNIFKYNTPNSQLPSHFITIHLLRWNRVFRNWNWNYRRRGIAQKEAYDIQKAAKVWNQELVVSFYVLQYKIIVLFKHLSWVLNYADIQSRVPLKLNGISTQPATKICVIFLKY
jgi:hypothetical protein